MNKALKKFFAALLITILTAVLFVPVSAFAQAGTLGTEEPYLYCTFTDEGGNTVDGNALTAGDYTVNVYLEGMQSLSVFQFTAEYNTSVVTPEINSSLADATDMSLGGIKYDSMDGNTSRVVIAMASEAEDCTSITAEGTLIATMSVTVASAEAIDFQDYFQFVIDPDLTFAEADYGDGIEDAYAIDMNAETAYNKYPMTADESPALGYDVSGRIMIAREPTGVQYTGGITGITVSLDAGSNTISAVTAADGSYTLPTVPAGTYNVTISGPTTIDRNVTLVVSDNKAENGVIQVAVVPICICDYDANGTVNGNDVPSFFTGMRNNYVYCDLDANGSANGNDAPIMFNFVNKNINYDDVTL